MLKKILLLFAVFLLSSSLVFADGHYTYEHALEMKDSGRIDWRDYGQDAFDEAIEENKPIFLMLTAPSWCYWCHVYTSDDYVYHDLVYPIINENFIPIYVDADKRQDLTRQYLEGGWPSTTVLTPNGERIYGYSGPRDIDNMILNLNMAVEYVQQNSFASKLAYEYKESKVLIPTEFDLQVLIDDYQLYIPYLVDSVHGGFGTGQKFPQARTLDYCLDLYEKTTETKWLDIVKLTLENQYTEIDEIETNYNLFDPVEGGFHRYGTAQDWTPPHYEKMLYDNAKLLRAYNHLLVIDPEYELANEVVQKTISFMKENWWDEDGGFYGNSDVHGEDAYYGKAERSDEKPRVEKTKYTDWNSEAILTFLYIDQDLAEQTLDFFLDEMKSDYGMYHYIKEDGEKGVRGSFLDNAYFLLALVEANDVLGGEYLDEAYSLANYSLENLYDVNSGGFFERNSPDIETYAFSENINLDKPAEENGIMIYALLRLYETSEDLNYLNAAIKTMGKMMGSYVGLDFGYYYVKSAEFILEHDLLADFELNKEEIELMEAQAKQDFWLNEPLNVEEFEPSEEGLDTLGDTSILLILVAFLAGLLSFLSPCTLPILPAYLAHALKTEKKHQLKAGLYFLFGLVLVFTFLGLTASFIGQFLKENLILFSQFAGIFIVLLGVFILFGKGFGGFKIKVKSGHNFFTATLVGVALGISWTPCVGPILVALLLLAASTSTVFSGGLLLFVYALGLGLPLILFSYYLKKIDRKGKFWKFLRGKELKFKFLGKTWFFHTSMLLAGIIFIILGIMIFQGTLTNLNQYFVSSSLQEFIFSVEEWLLDLVD